MIENCLNYQKFTKQITINYNKIIEKNYRFLYW